MKHAVTPPVATFLLALVAIASVSGCDNDGGDSLLPEVAETQRIEVTNNAITNLEAPIPPQCYTKTEDRFNPCYTCHQRYPSDEERMNRLDDGALQGGYAFSDVGLSNHWSNLFVDRQQWLEQVSDEAILAWIKQDNYRDLPARLKAQDWKGFVPDLNNYANPQQAFDAQGFAMDGSDWVAFNYKPFPGTFWPTNGSTDDVIIRLPKAFRELRGKENRDIYLLNLSLLEMAIKQLDRISIPAMDETVINTDLDGDGMLEEGVRQLQKRDHYLGDAADVALAKQQYPTGTEFMHSVRYVGIDDSDNIVVPPRMKELRYMRKIRQLDPYDVDSRYARERKDKRLGMLPTFINHFDEGMENGMGWMVSGFIEDYDGELRPQTFEENMQCMGCHAAVGTTIDQTFSFARKVTGADGWGYINTRDMQDAPSITETEGEILNYLKRAGGGSEFRENPEMLQRWYHADGSVDVDKVRSADVYTLISPSRERALKLNKAYTHIVRHQSYIRGRDATWLPAENVFEEVDAGEPPLPREHQYYGWDIRLNWSAGSETHSQAAP
ncbi:hypothetical protein [Alcanivorax sp. DP30]|uniref:hypothetical protein n=1 Tax=Alcanivorax sp. DP30 TaxID=2606217 RepID=UPI0013718675|nr:hypothetical protein [Alcanivorax sp. DP30]MZR62518.1 hypothetical protein [Alcanivorax sp. DP30]